MIGIYAYIVDQWWTKLMPRWVFDFDAYGSFQKSFLGKSHNCKPTRHQIKILQVTNCWSQKRWFFGQLHQDIKMFGVATLIWPSRESACVCDQMFTRHPWWMMLSFNYIIYNDDELIVCSGHCVVDEFQILMISFVTLHHSYLISSSIILSSAFVILPHHTVNLQYLMNLVDIASHPQKHYYIIIDIPLWMSYPQENHLHSYEQTYPIQKVIGKMSFPSFFSHWWDMLVPWRVNTIFPSSHLHQQTPGSPNCHWHGQLAEIPLQWLGGEWTSSSKLMPKLLGSWRSSCRFERLHSLERTCSPLKNDGWKTILTFFGKAYFQGDMIVLGRVSKCLVIFSSTLANFKYSVVHELPSCQRVASNYITSFTPPSSGRITSRSGWQTWQQIGYSNYDKPPLLSLPLAAVMVGLGHCLSPHLLVLQESDDHWKVTKEHNLKISYANVYRKCYIYMCRIVYTQDVKFNGQSLQNPIKIFQQVLLWCLATGRSVNG